MVDLRLLCRCSCCSDMRDSEQSVVNQPSLAISSVARMTCEQGKGISHPRFNL